MRQGGAYRRGAVAGLSLGEVFILLSFVLVLAVLQIDETQHEDRLGHVGTPDASGRTPPDPNEIQTLSAEAESLRRELGLADAENAKLSEVLAEKEVELKQAHEQFKQTAKENENGTNQLSAEALNQQLSAAKAEAASQLQELNAKLQLAEEKISELEDDVRNETERRAEAEAKAEAETASRVAAIDELAKANEHFELAAEENANLINQLSVEALNQQLSAAKAASQLQELSAKLQLEEDVRNEIERHAEAEAEAASQLQELNATLRLAEKKISELEEDVRSETERRAEAEAKAEAETASRVATSDELAKANRRFELAAEENADLASQLSAEALNRQQAEENIAELLRNLQELIAELQRSRARLAQAEETISNLEGKVQRENALRLKAESDAELERVRAAREEAARADATKQLEIQKEEARKEAEERAKASVSKEEKGENPPCWYVRVPKVGEGTREKQIYALNILVTDEFIMFGNRGLPSGKPDRDEQGDFTSEAKALGLPNFPYGEQINDAEASRHLKRLFNAGQDKDVRSYPCWFFAQVWDQTSTDSKARWRSIREDVIEPYVLIYRVKDDPWPGPSHQ